MTVAKFKVVIRREKLSKSTNEAPVCLRITKDRKVTYKTLLHLDPKYWNDKEQCVKKQHPNAEGLNAVISQRRGELEKETCFLSLKDDSVGIETIRNKINDRFSFDLFEYADRYIENLRKNQKHATYKKYKSVIKKLRFYVGKGNLPIKSICFSHCISNNFYQYAGLYGYSVITIICGDSFCRLNAFEMMQARYTDVVIYSFDFTNPFLFPPVLTSPSSYFREL